MSNKYFMYEAGMNQALSKSGANNPKVLGYAVDTCRLLNPATLDEFIKAYVPEEKFKKAADQFYGYILENQKTYNHFMVYGCTPNKEDCENYLYDVLYRRTFMGYAAESAIRDYLFYSTLQDIYFTDRELDVKGVDLLILKTKDHPNIGIQVKNFSYLKGHYDTKDFSKVSTQLANFQKDYQAQTYTIYYSIHNDNVINIVNPDTLEEIRQLLVSAS